MIYVRYQQITRKIRAIESTKWQLIAFGDLSFRRPNNVKPRKRDNSIMQNRVRIKYVRDKYNIIKIKTFTVSFMSDSAKKSRICKWMNLKLSTKATFPFHYKCAENNQKMVVPNLVSQKKLLAGSCSVVIWEDPGFQDLQWYPHSGHLIKNCRQYL